MTDTLAEKPQRKPIKVGSILLWLLAVLLVPLCVIAFMSNFLSGFLILLSIIVVMPPSRKLFSEAAGIKIPVLVPIVLCVICFGLAIAVTPKSTADVQQMPESYSSPSTGNTEAAKSYAKELSEILSPLVGEGKSSIYIVQDDNRVSVNISMNSTAWEVLSDGRRKDIITGLFNKAKNHFQATTEVNVSNGIRPVAKGSQKLFSDEVSIEIY